MAHTKIVATLGPATDRPGVLDELVTAGVDVFRLNASHSTQEQLQRRVHDLRAAQKKAGREHTALLLDLQGPKIRLEKFTGGEAHLEAGREFTITTETVMGTAERASTSYADFAHDVQPGNRILLADGAIELRALTSDGVSVRTEVVSGGRISDRKGINLPGVRVSAPSLTEKDASDLDFALREDIDLIAISFVRTAADVVQVRHRMRGKTVPIIAKIEKPEAWENIDGILQAADGAMVARGDLGVEVALEKVPRIQKSIIRRARRLGRCVITATQMLESMTENPMPTRAEVSDVANAIYDGTDAVMLSGETAMGRYPVESVRVMERIAIETENAIRARGFQDPTRGSALTIAEILADSAFHAARDADAAAIVVFTSSGSSARLISRYRPPVPIYAVTHRTAVARQLAVAYGVTPLLAPEVESTDRMLELMDRLLLESGHVKFGQPVVFVAGQPIGRPGTTNLMKIHRIGH